LDRRSEKSRRIFSPALASFLDNPFYLLPGFAGEKQKTFGEKKFVEGRKARRFIIFVEEREMAAASVCPNNIAGSAHGWISIHTKTDRSEFQTTCFSAGNDSEKISEEPKRAIFLERAV
jgi:hypothetical protein